VSSLRRTVTGRGDATPGDGYDPRAVRGRHSCRAVRRIIIGDDYLDLIAPAGVVGARDFDGIKQARQVLLFIERGNDYRESHKVRSQLSLKTQLATARFVSFTPGFSQVAKVEISQETV